mgnify:CR=1 FL=1
MFNKYKDKIKKCANKIAGKDCNKYEFPLMVAKELGVSRVYGNGIYYMTTYMYAIPTSNTYTVYGLLDDNLVMITIVAQIVHNDVVRFNSSTLNSTNIIIRDLCTRNENNEIVFKILDECNFGIIDSIYASKKQVRISFFQVNKSGIDSLCKKYNNIKYKGVMGKCLCIDLKQSPVKESYGYIFDFDLL